MSFQQGLSGLNASSAALDVLGNNIANANTVGFKSGNVHFADVYANSLSGGGASQIGIGSTLSAIQQSFSQGNITATTNPLDISINGGGFFRMNRGGEVTYARNGQFHLDNAGFIVNDSAMRVTGYPADANGLITVSNPVDLQLSASQIPPRATSDALAGNLTGTINLDSRQGIPAFADPTKAAEAAAATSVADAAATAAMAAGATLADVTAAATAASTAAATAAAAALAAGNITAAAAAAATAAAAAASTAAATGATPAAAAAAAATSASTYTAATAATFDPGKPQTYNYSTAVSVYDTLGVAHNMTMYFERAFAGGPWNVHATLDGQTPQSLGTLSFNKSGTLTTAMPITLPAWALTSGAVSPWSPGKIDFTGTTQYGSASSVDRLTQGGYTTGSLTGLNVGGDGVVKGRYSNGQSRNLGQIVLATFANPNGLQSLGNNQWALSSISGPELIGEPGAGSRGVLQSASVEESNVDLTKQLVDMITQQRNYQANAQTIKTQDQILQTLVNLR